MSDGEVLICAEHISKKFCRSLKRSLWYGAQDVANSLMPWKRDPGGTGANDDMVFREPELRKDEFWAVRDVSFEVRRGECLGLIGHNGAGKSTLLKMLNSLNRPDSGRITMKGRVGALIELSAGFNPILTGRENIYNQAALIGFNRWEIERRFDEIVQFSGLEEFLDMPVQNYSSGMRVRLGFAVTSHLEPDILLVDEVLAVGDAEFRFKCINRMADVMSRTAVIFVSHTMPHVLRVCNRVMHLDHGMANYLGTDVSKGVGGYYERLPDQGKTLLGTGGVRLESIEIGTPNQDSMRSDPIEVEYGQSIELRMSLSVDANIDIAIVQVLIWNQDLLAVLDVLGPELKGIRIKNSASGRHMVKLVLDNVNLNSGMHFVTVLASSQGFKKHYLQADNAAAFRMVTRTPSGAQSLTEGSWTVDSIE